MLLGGFDLDMSALYMAFMLHFLEIIYHVSECWSQGSGCGAPTTWMSFPHPITELHGRTISVDRKMQRSIQ